VNYSEAVEAPLAFADGTAAAPPAGAKRNAPGMQAAARRKRA